MENKKNNFETIYEVGKFSARINGTDYEIVRNGLKVVETLKFDQYDEDEVADYTDKCEFAHKVISDIKRAIDMVINLDGSYHTFKNAVESLEEMDTPKYMMYDVLDLERKLIRMMVWASTPLTTTESQEISMTIFGMMVNDLEEVKRTIHKIIE
jgi:hypothetical protein